MSLSIDLLLIIACWVWGCYKLVSNPCRSSPDQNLVVFLFVCEWYENTFHTCYVVLISWFWYVCSTEMARRNDTAIASVIIAMAQALTQVNANAMQGHQNQGVLMSWGWVVLCGNNLQPLKEGMIRKALRLGFRGSRESLGRWWQLMIKRWG